MPLAGGMALKDQVVVRQAVALPPTVTALGGLAVEDRGSPSPNPAGARRERGRNGLRTGCERVGKGPVDPKQASSNAGRSAGGMHSGHRCGRRQTVRARERVAQPEKGPDIAPSEARERRRGCNDCTFKTFRWDLVGNQSHPVEPGQQPEANLASAAPQGRRRSVDSQC
jgi:hypothetical protein